MANEHDAQKLYSLKTADRTYRVLIESMNQAAMTIADDGAILYSNSQFSRMIAKPLDQIIGERLETFFKPEDRPALRSLYRKNISGQMVQEMECELPGTHYAVVVISATRLPVVEPNAHMAIVITDITERKRAEKAKDEFVSLASHQLRTPATAVKLYLGMLLEGYAGELSENHRTFITTAYNSNERQLVIINSILRTAQIDSGVYRLKKSPQNLAALIDMILIDFRPVLLMREHLLACDVDESITVNVDPAEMSVALTNIIENASKYSPNGKPIAVSATQSARATTILVKDQGVGIDSSNKDKIFEKFTRIDNALSDTVNGSGLGLYWVKRIIEMHGGTISLTSKLGKGTTFSVRLPR